MVHILILILIFLIFIISISYTQKLENFEIANRKCLGYPSKNKKKYKDNLFFHLFFSNHKKKNIHKKYNDIFLKSKLLNNIFDNKNKNSKTSKNIIVNKNKDYNKFTTKNNTNDSSKNYSDTEYYKKKNNIKIIKEFPDYNPLHKEFKNLKIGVENSLEKMNIKNNYSKNNLFSKNFDDKNQYDIRNIYESNSIYLDKKFPKFDKINWNFKKTKSLIPKNFKFLDEDYFTDKKEKFKYKRDPNYNLVDYRENINKKSNKYLYSDNNFFNIKTINSVWEKSF